MSDSLGQRPWMTTPAAVKVFDALEAEGGADCARFVGGCVRNALLGQAVDDIDIATTLTPDRTTRALEKAGIRAIPTGIDHGTVTAVCDGAPLEITTLRRDVSTDGRRAVVAFTQDWSEDARRRDFTLNTLYADRSGKILDPTGRGVEDGRAGRIVFVGDADTRIREDHLRILRYFRFLAWYGRGEPDADAVEACARQVESLKTLPAERVAKELLKLLAADDPRMAVRLMERTGALQVILPFGRDLGCFDALVAIQSDMLFEADAVLRLATLAPSDQVGAARAAESLRLSNDIRDRLAAAAGTTPRITSWMSPRETRRALYAIGRQAFGDRVRLAWAASANSAAAHQWRGLLALGESWTPPAFPLTGDEVVQAGVPRGPLVGQVLREVEAWWIDHDFIEDKFSAIEKLKAVAQGLAY